MASSVLVFMVWTVALIVVHGMVTAPWHRAHAELLKKLAEREAGRPLGGKSRSLRLNWLNPGLIRWTFVFYFRRGLYKWFITPDPDPDVERLRLRSVALFETARRRSYVLIAIGVVGAAVIFRLAARVG
jgi:hypothetical protein